MAGQKKKGRKARKSLLVPADEAEEVDEEWDDDEILSKCDVGGCEGDGTFTFAKWLVCIDHFHAYLNNNFDLSEYFQLKEGKITGEIPLADDTDYLLEYLA